MTDLTFASVLAETNAARRKSDLQNLAHAHVDLTHAIAEGQALQAEIEALAANPTPPLEDVKRLYDRARRFGFR